MFVCVLGSEDKTARVWKIEEAEPESDDDLDKLFDDDSDQEDENKPESAKSRKSSALLSAKSDRLSATSERSQLSTATSKASSTRSQSSKSDGGNFAPQARKYSEEKAPKPSQRKHLENLLYSYKLENPTLSLITLSPRTQMALIFSWKPPEPNLAF